MKYVPLLTLALMIALPAHAQDVPSEEAPPTDTPAPADVAPVAEPEPEVSEPVAEPEPEVSEPVAEPEPEVSTPVTEPEPEVSTPVAEPEPEVSDGDAAAGLGSASPEDEPSVEADLAASTTEAEAPVAEEEEESGGGTLSAAERLSSMTGAQGLPWTLPFSWSNNLSVDTLRPQRRPTYNPLYSMTFSLAPRYVFTPVVSIGARMSLDVEFTDSNFTPEPRDLEWGDLQFDARFALPWRLAGIGFAPAIALRLPTSQLSRGQSRALGPTVRLAAIKAFDVAQGLVMGGSFGYTFWIHSRGERVFRNGTATVESTVRDITGARVVVRNAGTLRCNHGAFDAADPTAFGVGGCNGGNQVRHQPSIAGFVSLVPVSGLTVSLSFATFWLTNRGHDNTELSTDQVVTSTGDPLSIGDTSLTHTTTVTSFSASVGYDWASWLTTTLGYSTLSFFPDSDGSFENVIYNENSQFNLSVSFRPSALITQLNAEADDDAEEEETAAATTRRAF